MLIKQGQTPHYQQADRATNVSIFKNLNQHRVSNSTTTGKKGKKSRNEGVVDSNLSMVLVMSNLVHKRNGTIKTDKNS